MSKGKSRTATYRRVNDMLATRGTECEWWDGGYPECMLPWAKKGPKGCNGNPFVCKKLYLHHLAAAKKIDKYAKLDFEEREKNTYKIKPI